MPSYRYVPIPGSDREPMRGATKVRPADPSEPVHLTVVLRPRPADSGAKTVEDVVARGERLTRSEYEAQYGADPEDVEKVEEFAQEFGLTVSDVNLAARTLRL